MLIRPARNNDVDEIIEMGSRMHKDSNYAFLPYDHEKVRHLACYMINDPNTQCALVAEERGLLIGMFAGYITDYYFCNSTIASDMILYVEPKYRGSSAAMRLIRTFRDWAIQKGVSEICLGTSTGVSPERTGNFYQKLGFVFVGGIYKWRTGTNAQ
ncbi:MAG: GNAT family N-acetyltransferase [Thermodesulfobacteriota bacterium]|nr:GNAT family N-acetyltransferase [Thermodesulfobacteriota bacterium]